VIPKNSTCKNRDDGRRRRRKKKGLLHKNNSSSSGSSSSANAALLLQFQQACTSCLIGRDMGTEDWMGLDRIACFGRDSIRSWTVSRQAADFVLFCFVSFCWQESTFFFRKHTTHSYCLSSSSSKLFFWYFVSPSLSLCCRCRWRICIISYRRRSISQIFRGLHLHHTESINHRQYYYYSYYYLLRANLLLSGRFLRLPTFPALPALVSQDRFLRRRVVSLFSPHIYSFVFLASSFFFFLLLP